MAHKKSWWTAQNIHDSPWQRLWVKKFAGQKVLAGNILVRQRWTKWHPWNWVWIWRDHTVFATIDWVVSFTEKKLIKFNWRIYKDIFVHVTIPWEHAINTTKKIAPKVKKVERKSDTFNKTEEHEISKEDHKEKSEHEIEEVEEKSHDTKAEKKEAWEKKEVKKETVKKVVAKKETTKKEWDSANKKTTTRKKVETKKETKE